MVQEEATVPGEYPGIYACDYKKLAQIMVATAEARLALMQGDAGGAEVWRPNPSHTPWKSGKNESKNLEMEV